MYSEGNFCKFSIKNTYSFLFRYLSFFLALMVLTACGGGGGGNTNPSSGGGGNTSVPLSIISASPVDGMIGISVIPTISATFSEPMKASSINNSTFLLNGPAGVVPGAVSYNGTMATFTPTANLVGGATYTATITASVQDTAGTAMGMDYSWSFMTSNAGGGSTVSGSTVGGNLAGLVGTLVLSNNGSVLTLTADGSYTFTDTLVFGDAYSVAVAAQPAGQTCIVNNPVGIVSSANVTNVSVNCSTNSYTIGGTATGLTGSGLVLQNNAGDNLTVSANGSFTFATPITYLGNYAVSSQSQPAGQTCTVTNGSGTVSGTNVTNVSVNCSTNTYTVGGTVTGLTSSGLVLQNNAGDNLTISANGSFTFATPIPGLSSYIVTVQSQPTSPNQTCAVSDDSGIVSGANVVNISVNCFNSYTVGGAVSGLAGSGFVLQNNVGDDLAISANGNFVFGTPITDLGDYAVSVQSQPMNPNQSCVVSNNSGTVSGADISNISVNCTNTYTVGGTVSGLTGSGLMLQNNAGDDLVISGNGNFTFDTPITELGSYIVTVQSQPSIPKQTCTITNSSGTLVEVDITSATVSCVDDPVAIISPVDGATDIERNAVLTATFNKDMFATTINDTSFTFSDGNSVAGSVEFDALTNIANFKPTSDLAILRSYTANLDSTITDLSGNPLTPLSWNFTTRDGVWGAAELIETSSAGHAFDPQIAMDANGNAVAVWRLPDGPDPYDGRSYFKAWVNRYTAGIGWGTAVVLSPPRHDVTSPQIAMDTNGNGIVVWHQDPQTGANLDVLARRFNSSGGWGSAIMLSDGITSAVSPQIAFDFNDNAIAVWVQNGKILGKRYTAGTGWGAEELIASPSTEVGVSYQMPQVAFDSDGNIAVVWEEREYVTTCAGCPAFFTGVLANRYIVGSGWGTPVSFSGFRRYGNRNPQIAMDANGNGLVVFRSGTTDIVTERYTADVGWVSTDVIDSSTGGADYQQIAMEGNGNAIAVWSQSGSIWANHYTIGVGWGAAKIIDSSPGNAGAPQTVMEANGNALAVWVQDDGTGLYKPYSNRYISGVGWGAPALIENVVDDANSPQIAIDASGNAIAVWTMIPGSRINVYANRFD